MAQALRVRLEASTAKDAVHQPVLTKTLGNLDRQEALLEALARLIHPLVPVDNGHKGRSRDRCTQPQPHHVRPGNLHGRGPKDRPGGKQERRDGLTGHALTAERRPTSLGTHDGRRVHMRVEGNPLVLAHRD
jgi:hypothetical protein